MDVQAALCSHMLLVSPVHGAVQALSMFLLVDRTLPT